MQENTNVEQNLKLLVVEDEVFLRDLLSMKFNSEGIALVHADNGQQALKLAEDEKPDAILLDLVLPDSSGFEILEQLKSQEATSDIPVIILSNLGQEEEIKKGMSMGASAFLIKAHFSPAAIVNKIKAIVAHKK